MNVARLLRFDPAEGTCAAPRRLQQAWTDPAGVQQRCRTPEALRFCGCATSRQGAGATPTLRRGPMQRPFLQCASRAAALLLGQGAARVLLLPCLQGTRVMPTLLETKESWKEREKVTYPLPTLSQSTVDPDSPLFAIRTPFLGVAAPTSVVSMSAATFVTVAWRPAPPVSEHGDQIRAAKYGQICYSECAAGCC